MSDDRPEAAPLLGGSWFPRVHRMKVLAPWKDYRLSDPFGDLERAKTEVFVSTSREPVAITLTHKSASELRNHPDVIDRLRFAGPADNQRKVTVTDSAGRTLAACTYSDGSGPARDPLKAVLDPLRPQVAVMRHSELSLLAVVYNDAMAIELFAEDAA